MALWYSHTKYQGYSHCQVCMGQAQLLCCKINYVTISHNIKQTFSKWKVQQPHLCITDTMPSCCTAWWINLISLTTCNKHFHSEHYSTPISASLTPELKQHHPHSLSLYSHRKENQTVPICLSTHRSRNKFTHLPQPT